MTFDKDSMERKMFGCLNSMVKKYLTMERVDAYELYLECVRFGTMFEVSSDIPLERDFAHALAFEFMKYVIHSKKEHVFQFTKESREYQLCLAFYRLAQRFWQPFVAQVEEDKELEENFWSMAIEEVTTFYTEFSLETEGYEKGLAFQWGSLLLERLDAISFTNRKSS